MNFPSIIIEMLIILTLKHCRSFYLAVINISHKLATRYAHIGVFQENVLNTASLQTHIYKTNAEPLSSEFQISTAYYGVHRPLLVPISWVPWG